MLTIGGTCVYRRDALAYKERVSVYFHLGDVIRRAREKRGWNQDTLGVEAGKYLLDPSETKINKATVSKIERSPYSSEIGTVLRLLAALDMTLCDAHEAMGGSPVTHKDARPQKAAALERSTVKRKRAG